MMWPLSWAMKRGSADAMPYSTPLRLTSIMASHSSTFTSDMGRIGIRPALLIITSRPWSATMVSTTESTFARSVTSMA